MQVFHARVACG